MARLTGGTWVLVADGEKALILENHGDADYIDLRVLDKEEQENPPTREQAANRRGRMSDSQGNKSAFEDTDWHELQKDRFADDLAELLYAHAHKGAFDRIVLVAAPGVLGEIRKKLHQEVESKVIAEIPKTLTNHSLDAIEQRVAEDIKDAA
ncbi:protein required for attachment to host cells [Hasllibacter halocynthiae]|uniref:Protein required for attachment to host cells n=1 Tax=Hasllibacter halocynthiae TaxID=595589 RepID=A0A2T0X1T0_9RHOB|nr:host attachment family protein [Hasllibacter halocynthiae]PRY92909.1 protein required for attachment to host cells [Hasllibacter halocynthiae]